MFFFFLIEIIFIMDLSNFSSQFYFSVFYYYSFYMKFSEANYSVIKTGYYSYILR